MNGYVYTLGKEKCETYTKTTKDIALYHGKTYKDEGNVKKTLDRIQMITIPKPSNLPTPEAAIPKFIADLTAILLILAAAVVPKVLGLSATNKIIRQQEIDDYA